MWNEIKESSEFIKNQIKDIPVVAIVLGSGLGRFTDGVEIEKTIPYSEIPHFKTPTVEGHSGELIFAKVGNNPIVALRGRIHMYEGHSAHEASFAVRVLANLGVKNLILSNASGAVNTDYRPGQLILVKDHINFTGQNPLVGENLEQLGPRFPDMGQTYTSSLRELAKEVGNEMSIDLREGIYCGVLGPSYETPAEIRMIRTLGGDLVGMSTVVEAIAANHAQMNILCLSCVTNMAAGILDEELTHEDVKNQANIVTKNFSELVTRIVAKI